MENNRIQLTIEKIELRKQALEKAKAKRGPDHPFVKFLESQIKKLEDKVGHLTNYSIKF